MQELEPSVGEKLVGLWNNSSSSPRPSSAAVGSCQTQSPPSSFLATQRLQQNTQHTGADWTAPQQKPYSPWNVGPLPRQQANYGGQYSHVDYGMQQYAYAVQASSNLPQSYVSGGAGPITTTQTQTSSVMILQRSAGSEPSGPRALGP